MADITPGYPMPGNAWTAGPCLICGTLFLSPHHADRTCSPDCRGVHQTHLNAARRARKRARTLQADTIDVFNHRDVFARDNYTCRLCGEPVDMDSEDPALQPTLDHIVPLSKGGQHAWSNVQLAHHICNQYKRDLTGKKAAKAVRAGLLRRARRVTAAITV